MPPPRPGPARSPRPAAGNDAPTGPSAVQGSTVPVPLLPKARPVGANSYRIAARAGTVPMHPTFGPTRVFGYDDGSGRGLDHARLHVRGRQGHRRPGSLRQRAARAAPVRQRGPRLHARRHPGPDEHPPARRPRRRLQRRQPVRVPGRVRAGAGAERHLSERPERDPALVPRPRRPDHPAQRVRRPRRPLPRPRRRSTPVPSRTGSACPAGRTRSRWCSPTGCSTRPASCSTPPTPTWIPEFFGDTPLVNGAAQPYLAVEPRIYRFRILNASNARFWNLTIQGGPPAYQIGSDGGLFDRPVPIGSCSCCRPSGPTCSSTSPASPARR